MVNSSKKIDILIFAFILLFPMMSHAQEWYFDPDSLRDDGPTIPILINPLLDGIIPEHKFDKSAEGEKGKVYNGYMVQVLLTKNAEQAEDTRMKLVSQIVHEVNVIFEAPNYKVRIGKFINRQDAERLRTQLINLGYRRAWIIRAQFTL